MEAMNRWCAVQVNLTIAVTIARCVQVFPRTSEKAVRFRIPSNLAEQFEYDTLPRVYIDNAIW